MTTDTRQNSLFIVWPYYDNVRKWFQYLLSFHDWIFCTYLEMSSVSIFHVYRYGNNSPCHFGAPKNKLFLTRFEGVFRQKNQFLTQCLWVFWSRKSVSLKHTHDLHPVWNPHAHTRLLTILTKLLRFPVVISAEPETKIPDISYR